VKGVRRDANDEVAAIYAAACPRLIGYLTVLGGNRADAEEVAQEAFVRLLENWRKVRTYDDPQAWLRQVATRAMISRGRRRTTARLGAARLAAHQGDGTTPPVDAAGVDLDRALQQLSIEHRAVLLLHHVHDLPVSDVAATLGLPVGTVKSRLARARAAIEPSLKYSDPTGSAS
jgi:RNA polymerase sigma-70 factor (ECF subfamily)